jgi:hypothetical protein
MVKLDADILRADPAKVALATSDPAVLQDAQANPDPNAPACQAAIAAYRPALIFRYIFTTFVAVLGAMTTIGLGYCIYRIFEGWSVTATLAALGSVVTGSAALWLTRKMRESIRVLRQALDDVATYCGTPVADQLK